MIFLLFAAAMCASLRVFESYEVDGILAREKGVHEVYLLVLFRAPSDVGVTSSAFSRLISAIPIPVDPFLGVVVDPNVKYNQLVYQDKSGSSARIRFPYRQVLREYVESVSSGVSHEIQVRLRAILAVVNDNPIPSRSDEVNRWRRDYAAKGVRLNMTRAVEELVVLKNQERAGLIRQALDIQKTLDGEVGDRRSLPAFSQVDPSKGEYDAQVAPEENEPNAEKQGKPGFDEESAENDDVVGEDEAPKSLTNTKPQGDNDDEGSTGPSDDDAEEDRKRAGPIRNAWEAVRYKFRRKTPKSDDEQNGEDESNAPKKKQKEDDAQKKGSKPEKSEDHGSRRNKEGNVKKKREKAEGSGGKKALGPKRPPAVEADDNPTPRPPDEVRPEGRPPVQRPRFGPGRITEPPGPEPPKRDSRKVEQPPPEPPKVQPAQPRFGPGRITEPPPAQAQPPEPEFRPVEPPGVAPGPQNPPGPPPRQGRPEFGPPPHRLHRPPGPAGPDVRGQFPKPEAAAPEQPKDDGPPVQRQPRIELEKAEHREEPPVLLAAKALNDLARWNRVRQRRVREAEVTGHQAGRRPA